MATIFPAELTSVEIFESDLSYPVHRIYCVGRNYADHAREMGANPEREAPFFFCKPADAIFKNHGQLPYPSLTQDLHHEIELVVALGKGGVNIPVNQAEHCIFGYALGLDLTRRDLQAEAKKQSRPWDTAKAFDNSAPITAICPVEKCGHITEGEISLHINGELKQKGDVSDLIWTIPEVISQLSTLFELKVGDLIFTGTPAGVGPINKGDKLEGRVKGLESLGLTVQ